MTQLNTFDNRQTLAKLSDLLTFYPIHDILNLYKQLDPLCYQSLVDVIKGEKATEVCALLKPKQ